MHLSAQNISNPYASIGKKAPKVATVTDGEYEEFFRQDSLVQIGTTVMNRYTGEVAFFEEDNLEKFKQFTEHSEKNFRFLSVDPLSSKFPYYSPYHFAGNTPIQALDLDGLEILNYKTPYRLELGGTQLKIKYSYSDDNSESWQMANTAGAVSGGLAGWQGEQLPMDVPIYPTATNQYLYEINESQQAIYTEMTAPMGASTGERDGQGMAAKKKEGEVGARPNTAQQIQKNGEARAAAIEYVSKSAFSISPLAKSVEAKYDVNAMVKAYNNAWTMVGKSLDFTEKAKNMKWTETQVNQFKVDIANFVVDGKLPNNVSPEYSRSVSDNGMIIINSDKDADVQKPLKSGN